jgi:YteA family regulatory protein
MNRKGESEVQRERLNHFRSILLKEKQELEQQAENNFRFGLNNPQQDNELSSYDNHPADAGTEVFERSKDLALIDNAVTYLSEIEQAMKRIDDGTYGICLQCGKPIPEERLEVVPTARYCIEHQREHDSNVSQRRPVEEQFLSPPFGRTSFDEKDNETEIDGEDVWQILERYGSSDTPDTYATGRDDYNDVWVEQDEPVGYVEQIEGFIVTDIDGGAGENYDIVRNQAYEKYLERGEGETGNEIRSFED